MKNLLKTFLFLVCLIYSANVVTKALSFDALIEETKKEQSIATFKKTYSVLNQALLMGMALNNKYYTNFDDVWNNGILNQLNNPKDIPNGVILADSTQITYSKTGKPCKNSPENENLASKNTACAILTIDTNGNKAPNSLSTNQKINDRYTVLLYSDKVLTIPNSVEWNKINEYKKRRNY